LEDSSSSDDSDLEEFLDDDVEQMAMILVVTMYLLVNAYRL
jgi:hypothetical protein